MGHAKFNFKGQTVRTEGGTERLGTTKMSTKSFSLPQLDKNLIVDSIAAADSTHMIMVQA